MRKSAFQKHFQQRGEKKEKKKGINIVSADSNHTNAVETTKV